VGLNSAMVEIHRNDCFIDNVEYEGSFLLTDSNGVLKLINVHTGNMEYGLTFTITMKSYWGVL
jgi:hypothetical protein